MKSVATKKCKIPPVICILFQLNSTGVGHALEFSDPKIEETGYIYLLVPNHHWPNTALEGVCGKLIPWDFCCHLQSSVLLSWKESQGGSQYNAVDAKAFGRAPTVPGTLSPS